MTKILLLSRNPRTSTWVEALQGAGFSVETKEDPKKMASEVLERLPDLLILEKSLAPELIADLIFALKENLNLAFLPILLILRETSDFEDELPIDDFFFESANGDEVAARVKLAFARTCRIADNNPLTGLPGNTSILKAIQQKIDSEEEVAFCYVDLDNFKPFNDRYGFARGDEILRLVARLLSNSVQFHAGHRGFVGHVGGDDFVFICPLESVEQICQEIIDSFDRLVPHFLDEEDLERGYFIAKDRRGQIQRFPFPSISIAVVPNYPGKFKHYGEVASVAAQVKKLVKQQPGSAYFIDRRRGPYQVSG
ncbi:MAG: diguanylate cyclase [Thermodesulfobacteria bacterium]|nr:diguanylate cyclase [Thermodesulfobacteriota bacterium]